MKKHSSYNISWNGNILITTVVGTINIDDTRRVFNQLKLQVKTLNGAPWGNLVDVRQWGLSSTDIVQILSEMEDWVRQNGRTHLVFVLGDEYVEIKKFTLTKYLGNNLKKKEVVLVESIAEGLAWLEQHGFVLNSENQATPSLPTQT
ncbi:hypothetical protein [Aliiglaciecola sp. LCG003]|uniref:hypothetical protein n=1 Tax=Aliiglaciecola sp. LCG003 TaxID=3053655 RepID=UPI0025736336|nr:hypothetical protein [Aliiglaciecola sp. LCG003]WJG08151.1 hypothetical protein QR722_12460 [Aliiglaciecola sp. LCG003]